jgi:hydrogenase maturation factor
MVLVVAPGAVEDALAALAGTDQEAAVVGRVVEGSGRVVIGPRT